MSDGPFSISGALAGWESFLPPGAVVMVRRSESGDAAETSEKSGFIFQAPGIDVPAAKELFSKIVAALNLSSEDCRVLAHGESEAAGSADAQGLIRFVAEEGESVGAFETLVAPDGRSIPVLTTYSLTAMLKNPGLKKPVWAHLKEALAQMNA